MLIGSKREGRWCGLPSLRGDVRPAIQIIQQPSKEMNAELPAVFSRRSEHDRIDRRPRTGALVAVWTQEPEPMWDRGAEPSQSVAHSGGTGAPRDVVFGRDLTNPREETPTGKAILLRERTS